MAGMDAAQQVDAVWDKSEDDLFKYLGMAYLGTVSIDESIDSMNALVSVAGDSNADSAISTLGNNLQVKGQHYFKLLWDDLKGVVCTIYNGKTNIDQEKDLAAYLVDVVIAAGKIANPLAALVITIAVKKGLDKLCAVK